MDNWVDLSTLPRRKDGKISWIDCNNNKVSFQYMGFKGSFLVIKRISRRSILINFEDHEYTINPNSILQCNLLSFVRFAKLYCGDNEQCVQQSENNQLKSYTFNVKDCIDYHGFSLVIIKQIILRQFYTGYICEFSKDKHQFIITDYALRHNMIDIFLRKNGIEIGCNDLWTVKPRVAEMLVNPEEGFIYKAKSNKHALFKCPKCHKIVGQKIISSVSLLDHVSCPYCSDGVSYPNKFMANILDCLNINYKIEHNFDWCNFPSYYNQKKIISGKYDFVIEDMKLIIEMDGGLGHGNKIHSKSNKTLEETVYYDKQKDILAINHGYTIVRIDCNYTNSNLRFTYCKDNVIKSISNYFNLSSIDWNEIDKKCQNSNVIKCIDLYKNGYSPIEISKILKCDYTTIIKYLHKGEELHMCKFFPHAR